MKMNFLISIVCALLLGYLCATFIFREYHDTDSTFQEDNSVYFLQYGVYANPEKATVKANKYIGIEEDGKYYVYVGMTTSKKNAKKIQELYQGKGQELYIKELNINNNEFVNELSQYDILLDNSKTEEEINSVLSTVLASYEEVVLKR